MPPTPTDPLILFMRHVDKNGPRCKRYPDLGRCWLWTASAKGGGYGQFVSGGKNHQAHRWLYEHNNGPLPPSLDLDHYACDRRLCVRPTHVRPTTRLENILRCNGGGAGGKAAQTHCLAHHELPPYRPGVKRSCRPCATRRERERRARVAGR